MATILTTATAATAHRRQALAKKIKNGIVVITATAEAVRSRDTFYAPYRHNSYLYYLSGCIEPHTALILTADNGELTNEYFLCRAPDAHAARWEGKRLHAKTAKRQLAIADTADIERLPAFLAEHAARYETLFYIPGSDTALDNTIIGGMQQRRANNRRGARFPHTLVDVSTLLDEMRLIKDEYEITQMRHAAALSAAGAMAAMQAAATGARYEHEIEAAIIHRYRSGGGEHAFAPIVAAGKNACVLHYRHNNARIKAEQGVLVDTGCEFAGYAGDITRCFPQNGVWQGGFREVYAVVLAAQKSALRAAVAGVSLEKLETIATKKLVAGLRALKLCRGSADTILRKQSYRRFYMHSLGHWLGMDVHDVGSVREANGNSRCLRPGMVLTIEPGLYIPDEDDIPPALRGIGIRIEDDVLITRQGQEVLTASAPKLPQEIRAWMRGN
ncbi:MAG: aminopeptidase P N-terminal domain-containing protein [Proteobacteria bacterium]|nr:aminopeptidase P N-terminal domain-containing protein [Pseudomonadota bacterium]